MLYTMREQESMAVLIAKFGPTFCVQNFAHAPHFIPKIIAAPASMLITMHGTALQRCFLMNGPDRVANAVYYGRDLVAKTLIRLWTGPHFNAV